MMKRDTRLAALLLALATAACAAKNEAFTAKIEKIEKKVVDLTAPSDLFGSKDFLAIYENPKAHAADAAAYITSSASDQRKAIAGYSMQRLPKNDYLKFADEILKGKKAGTVSDAAFARALFPTMEWNTLFQENYKDPAVAAFLKKAKPHVSQEIAKNIDRILSGKAAKDVAEMRDAGQLPERKP